jgi:hypothetical protein
LDFAVGDYRLDKDYSLAQDGISWFLAPVEGLNMKQINTFAIYDIASRLSRLRNLPDDPALIGSYEAALGAPGNPIEGGSPDA